MKDEMKDAPHFRPVLVTEVCEHCFYYAACDDACDIYPQLKFGSVDGSIASFYV